MKRYLEALQGFNLAALLRGLQNGPRALARASRAAYAATLPPVKEPPNINREQLEAIPTCSLDDLLGDRKCRINLRMMKYEGGMMPYRDAVALLSLLVAENPAEVLEIGTFMGHTTRSMAENAPGAIIHTVDLPLDFAATNEPGGLPPKDDFHLINGRIVGREFKGQECAGRIVQHFGDTATMDFKDVGKPTFFFIDGSHTYEYCKNDSEKCLALHPRGGVYLWHDCNFDHPGVTKFILEWRQQGKNIVRIQGTDLAFWKS